MKDVVMPALGMAMTEGLLIAWLKAPGDEVTTGEAIAEIETDKAVMDLESPAEGIVGTHLVAAGELVPVGTVLVRVLAAGESEADPSSPAVPATGQSSPTPSADPSEETELEPLARSPHQLSPRERRLAKDAAATEDRSADAADRTSDRQRDAIARGVAESWGTIPHFSVMRELDAEAAMVGLKQLRTRQGGATVTDLLLRGLAAALAATVPGASPDIGLAVATEHGVVIAVVSDAGRLSIDELVDARAAAVDRARNGRLSPADLTSRPSGTLSNLGAYGVDSFTGIIPVGQVCLLTVGRIAQRVVAEGGKPIVRQTVIVTANVDHRHIDGDGAARLLDEFAKHLGAL